MTRSVALTTRSVAIIVVFNRHTDASSRHNDHLVAVMTGSVALATRLATIIDVFGSDIDEFSLQNDSLVAIIDWL